MIDFGKSLKKPEKLGIDNVIFGNESHKQKTLNSEEITKVGLEDIIPYSKNPFKLYEGERLEEMKRSILSYGILQPILVREILGSSKYEILAGHNRYNVAKILSEKDERFKEVPVRILRDIDDITAELIVSESNFLQRSLNDMRPSEKSFVIATFYNAEKRQGKRNDLIKKVNEILGNDEEILSGKEKASIEFNLSAMSIAKYSKINSLIDELKESLDNGVFDVDSAYNLSFLSPENQSLFNEYRERKKIKVNRKSSLEVKRLKEINEESLNSVFTSAKQSSEKSVPSLLKKYFPNKKKDEILTILDKLLEDYVMRNRDEKSS